ncbi:MAG TPA: hypothetical protein PL149_08030, partial [Candidatus Kapabacteria bacterium]|nr:hypothetical protein [Candidatus Kapabacteria bacterium]
MKKIFLLFFISLFSISTANSYLNLHSKKLVNSYREHSLATPVLSNTLLIRYKQNYNSKSKSHSYDSKNYKILA